MYDLGEIQIENLTGVRSLLSPNFYTIPKLI